MAEAFDEVGHRAIISSGTIIAYMDDQVKIKPFKEFPEYHLYFKVEFKDEYIPSRTSTLPSDTSEQVNTIVLSKKWTENNNKTSHHGYAFAESPEAKYYFAYLFETLGPIDKYAIVLLYVVTMERI